MHKRWFSGALALTFAVILVGCGATKAPVPRKAIAHVPSPRPTLSPKTRATTPVPTTEATPIVDCGSASVAGASSPPTTALTGTATVPTTWPERTVSALPNMGIVNDSVMDFANGDAYSIAMQSAQRNEETYQLERTDLSTGAMYFGPTFLTGDLAVTGADVWVFGTAGDNSSSLQDMACEVDPATMSVIKSLSLPSPLPNSEGVALGGGPDGSVWIGYGQSLVRVDVATGKVVATAAVPPGFGNSEEVALDPSGRYIYVSFDPGGANSAGTYAGAAVAEYDATTGRLLASTSTGPITDSAGGARLLAVPGGVWASFRTGMRGETILLRQRDLATLVPAPNVTSSIFGWMMGASLAYGDDTLFLSQDGGLVVCLDPTTGAVRATEQLPPSDDSDDSITLIGVSSAARVVYGTDDEGLVRLTPPAACWS